MGETVNGWDGYGTQVARRARRGAPRRRSEPVRRRGQAVTRTKPNERAATSVGQFAVIINIGHLLYDSGE